MSKVIVKTSGPFSLYDSEGNQIHARRPTCFENNQFLQGHVHTGKIEILLTGLSDEATDKEFSEYWNESKGDVELALESFRSAFPAPKEGDKTKPTRKTKEATK